MAFAAQQVAELGICDMIDINMGCPVPKVVKTGAGSALMKTPARAAEIITAVRNAVALPVTVKCRIGWDEGSINVRDFVKMAVDAGAQAVAVHARTRRAGYSGPALWEHLEGLGDICGRVPFIANGDLADHADLIRVREISGCSGFMIGRGSIGRPWLFSELLGYSWAQSRRFQLALFRRHLIETLMEHGHRGIPLFRVHLFGYLRRHPQAGLLRRTLSEERNPLRILRLAASFFLGVDTGISSARGEPSSDHDKR